MTWVSDYKYVWYEKFAMNVLRSSNCVPHHIAFVMDGNRRYAKSEHIRQLDGHTKGFEKLADCLRWCLDMGIKEVTTFAFSIENFKRSEEEVSGLLDLAREKFGKLLQESAKLHEHGVCIRVIGNVSLLPEDLQQLIARAVLETSSNDKLFLNVAFSYTARDEMTQAIETILKHGDDLQENDITDRLIEECLYTRHSQPPDLLIRTSGEQRISDFLMWQLSATVLYFTKILWPQITLWNFLAGVFYYQCGYFRLKPFIEKERMRRVQVAKKGNFYSERVQKFVQRVDECRKDFYLKLSSLNQAFVEQIK